MGGESFPLRRYRTLRSDAWWVRPAATAAALLAFAAYAAWALLRAQGTYAAPYLSPFHSPTPLIMWIPLALRLTCYDYRKSYYRSVLLSPPACAVADAGSRYTGESRFPLSLQNVHRYFFYLCLPVLGFLWWDVVRAFRFPDGAGVAVGSLLLLANAALLTVFVASCNSCRHICGGHLKSLHAAPLRARLWRTLSGLNPKHGLFGWISLGSVVAADLYVRLLAHGVLRDLRIL